MRIAIVTETFYPATDGICTRLTRFVVQLKQLGHEVIVISPDLGINEYEGVSVYGMDTFTLPLYGTRPWGIPNRKVREILEDFNPDIVHAVNPFSLAVSGVKYANRLNIPLITSYHTHMPKYLDYYNIQFLKPLFWEYIRHWHGKADYNITVSKALMDELNEQSVDTFDVLPRGIDLQYRHPKYFSKELYEQLTFNQPDKKLLVYVGRLAAEKDIHHLRPIFNYRDDICLVIVGDGPYREELERVFEGTPTTFVGFKHGEALSTAFATGDAFIFPSTSETFGLVISEAMASGLPVIAARNEPTEEQITNLETGIIYEPGSELSLIEAIRNIDNPLLMQKIKWQAMQEVQKYTWENATLKLLDFYQLAIARHDLSQKIYPPTYSLY